MIAEFEHFSALSGLTPPEEYSLADHKRAYYTGGLSESLDATFGAPAILDPETAVGAALNSTFAPLSRAVLGSRWVFDGDSVTINNIVTSGGIQNRGKSWTSDLAALSSGAIQYVFNAAVSGQSSADMLDRFDSVIAPLSPQVVFSTIGTNDVGAGVSFSTFRTNTIAYHEKVKAIGAQHIVGEIWPSHDSPAGRRATNREWNAWLNDWAASESDVIVMPWGQLADPATGEWPSGWSSDGIHPAASENAYASIALFALSVLTGRLGSPVIRRPEANGGDLLTNGFMTTLGTTMAPPSAPTCTPSTASGTLPAGDYEYKATAHALYADTTPSAATSVTLSGTGQISLSTPAGSPSANKGIAFYRKGPGDTEFGYIGSSASGSYGFVDDGSVTPGGPPPDVNRTAVPTGVSLNSATRHQRGGGWFSDDPDFRGNMLRVTPGAGASADWMTISSGFEPGDVVEISLKVRVRGGMVIYPTVRVRAGASNIATLQMQNTAYEDELFLPVVRFTVPATADTIRIHMESNGVGAPLDSYADWGEIGARVISTSP